MILHRKIRRIWRVNVGRVLAAMPWLWRDARCVFVLSTGRTGTETLQHLLALSPQIDAYHEPRPQLMIHRKHARWEIGRAPDKYIRVIQRTRGPKLYRSKARGLWYAETSARMTFFAPLLAHLLPNAKFLFIHRHPGEVVRSGMRRGWYENHPADFARIEPVPGEEAFKAWPSWTSFQKICWYWDAYNRFSLDARRRIGEERMLTLKADGLFDGSAVPAIFAHLGLDVPPADAVEAILSQRRNAQKAASFLLFEDWTPTMYEDLRRIAGDTMEQLGYSTELIDQ